MPSHSSERNGKRKTETTSSGRWSSPERSPSRSSKRDSRHPHKKSKSHTASDVERKKEPKVKTEPIDDGYQRHDRHENKHNPSHNDPRDRRPDNDVDHMRQQRNERSHHDRQRLQNHRSRHNVKEEPSDDHPWGGGSSQQSGAGAASADVKKEKEKPTLELSGKLAEETNTFRGVVIKYVEPAESRKPKKHWRFHPFKGDVPMPVLHLHRQSAYLLGRDRRVCDMPVDHPSISKQHAVLQFRLVPYKRANGIPGRRVSPYIIDLGSANGTYVNNQRIEAQRYVELLEKDVLKFGFSSRDYVLLHDTSDTGEVAQSDDEGEGD